jgi:hypothetical protein
VNVCSSSRAPTSWQIHDTMSAPVAKRAKRPLGSSCSSHARQFVAALQQRPGQLGT